jgi:hypothetical protein
VLFPDYFFGWFRFVFVVFFALYFFFIPPVSWEEIIKPMPVRPITAKQAPILKMI